MSITRLALKFAAPLPKLESFERYLFIGPHPDDIEIGAGATAAKLAAMGKKVGFLVCVDGRFGSAVIPPEELAAIRQGEGRASAKALGVDYVRYLSFCDGGFYDTRELTSRIAGAVGEFKRMSPRSHKRRQGRLRDRLPCPLRAAHGKARRSGRARQGYCLLHDGKAEPLCQNLGRAS